MDRARPQVVRGLLWCMKPALTLDKEVKHHYANHLRALLFSVL